MVNKIEVIDRTRRWLFDFVIGLSICPFAKHPFEEEMIDYQVYDNTDVEDCLSFLSDQLNNLDNVAPTETETTLIILTKLASTFESYLDLLDRADEVLVNLKLEGIFQIASFHPEYQFAGTEKDDISNHTNRSPYPMIHLLREDSVHEATQRHPDVNGIPGRNIRLLESMDTEEVKRFLK